MASTRIFTPPGPRQQPPRLAPRDLIALESPREVPKTIPSSPLRRLLPVVFVFAFIGMMVLMFTLRASVSPIAMLMPIMMFASMGGMLANGMGSKGKSTPELNEERKEYLRFTGERRKEVHDVAGAQYEALAFRNPHPSTYESFIGSVRMWERQPDKTEFLQARLGIGRQRLAVKVGMVDSAPADYAEPVSLIAAMKFLRAHRTVTGMPMADNLRGFSELDLRGADASIDPLPLLRAMLCHVALFHGPELVRIAVITDRLESAEWSWLKWLPHCQHPTAKDQTGSARLLYSSYEEFDADFGSSLHQRGPFEVALSGDPKDLINHPTPEQPYMIVVSDRPMPIRATRSNVLYLTAGNVARTDDMDNSGVTITLNADGTIDQTGKPSYTQGRNYAYADSMSVVEAAAFARAMARWRPPSADAIIEVQAEKRADRGLLGLLSIHNATQVNAQTLWKPVRDRDPDRLRVPIGFDKRDNPVWIDLKEAAEGGNGPHGLCIGETGSGKSEFLRSLVLAVCSMYSPDTVNLLFVDFKGGSTFVPFAHMPHVTALVTNMDDSKDLVDRMQDVIRGEVKRRQEFLNEKGYKDVASYEQAREKGLVSGPAMPTLFIVADEFSELLNDYPEFISIFQQIGRVGRSLRIHMLLASQRIDHGKFRDVESYIGYRIALRVASAAESRTIIGSPDAANLPRKPGAGILQTGNTVDTLHQFQSLFVSAPYVPPRVVFNEQSVTAVDVGNYTPPAKFVAGPMPLPDVAAQPAEVSVVRTDETAPESVEGRPTLAQTIANQLATMGRLAHPMWLPPLRAPLSLDALPASAAPRPGQLQIPLALIDDPYGQRQSTWAVDLTSSHLALLGTRQIGKSTALLTMLVSAGTRYSPRELAFFCIDFGGGRLNLARDLPNVAAVAGQSDSETIRRVFATVEELLNRRARDFATHKIASMADFRALKARGVDGLDEYGDVVLVIDGWDQAKPVIDEETTRITRLLGQGLSYGIHVVLTAPSTLGIGYKLNGQIATAIEFAGDGTSERLTTVQAKAVTEAMLPGRCMTKSVGLHMMVAAPRLDGVGDANDISAGFSAAVAQLVAKHGDQVMPKVELLPARPSLASVLEQWQQRPEFARDRADYRVPVGFRESDLAPARVSFMTDPHLVIYGSARSGKSTAISAVLEAITSTYTKDEASILLLDPKRQHLGTVPEDMLFYYGYTEEHATIAAQGCAREDQLPSRRPPQNVTPEQLMSRSWRNKREIFLVIDDYHTLYRRQFEHPLAAIVPFIHHGIEVGFHVIIARDITNAGLSLSDPLMSAMQGQSELIVLNGKKADGKLFDLVTPTEQPPARGQHAAQGVVDLVQIAESQSRAAMAAQR